MPRWTGIERARRARRGAWAIPLVTVALVGCARPRPADVPSLRMQDTRGERIALPGDLARARLTVLVFYADGCPCMRAHDGRVRDLVADYGPRGVDVRLVDSETEATFARDAEAARARALPPIVLAPEAALARALGATRATYTVVLDAGGHVRYRGAFDSDKNRLSDAPDTYLRDALDDLLAGRTPRRAEVSTLGCSLALR